ncbi:MAG: DUF86 domain-containing protein [Nitrospirae bacterium]|nr:DUF86 domain-containing protein [Nitrospirota bacterium]MCL5238758.1 DUF86 domain-containing protein [Nitrospirota bacterium]
MFDAAKEAVLFSEGKTRRSLNSDRKLVLALTKSIEIIGEAASKITPESCDSLPQIPWATIIGMRNRLIHAYYDINLDILWKTVKKDLPPLITELQKIFSVHEKTKRYKKGAH